MGKDLDKKYNRINDSTIFSYLSFIEDNNPRLKECRNISVSEACVYGVKEKNKIDFYIWGDSHVDQLMPMFDQISDTLNLSFMEFSFDGCPPLLGIERNDIFLQCESNSQALEVILSDKYSQLVILHSYWQYYFDENNIMSSDVSIPFDPEIKLLEIIDKITSTGKKVMIIGSIPRMPYDPPQQLARLRLFNSIEKPMLSILVSDHYKSISKSYSILKGIADKDQLVYFFDPVESLCLNNECLSNDGIEVFYRDDNHISVTGSMKLKKQLFNILSKLI